MSEIGMRVVQVIDSLQTGGAERLLVNFAAQARRRFWKTTVISLNGFFGRKTDLILPNALRSQGATVVSFPASHLMDPGRFWRLVHFLRGGGFDLVQTHLTYANILGVLAGRLAGIPAIATLHSTLPLAGQAHPIVGLFERLSLRFLAGRVVAVGKTVADVYEPVLRPRRIDVIPNAVPDGFELRPEDKQATRKEIAGDPGRTILISVGRFASPKGFEDLISAFAAVHASYPGTALVIVGDGPLFTWIQGLANSLGLQDCVYLPGLRNDVPRLLAAADLFVMSSHWEGLPLAVLEAMMAGLPVVATGVGDIPYVVTPDCGIVVPARHPQALAAAICRMVDGSLDRTAMGAAGQALAKRDYSTGLWMSRLAALYREVVQSKPDGKTAWQRAPKKTGTPGRTGGKSTHRSREVKK